MFSRITIASAAIALLATAALAQVAPHSQPPDTFKFLSSKDFDPQFEKLGPGPKAIFLGDHETYYTQNVIRTDTGNRAEVHVHWMHYLFVIAGEATLTYGGTVNDPQDTAPGEVRGSSITGGASVTVRPGDYVQIPAGMPHMLSPAKGATLHYIVFNTRQ